jgi:pentatricopeptide repeat protein
MKTKNFQKAEYYAKMLFCADRAVADVVYRRAIANCLPKRNVQQAQGLFQELIDNGVAASRATCNVIVSVCSRAGDIDACIRYVEEMGAPGGCGDDVVTYNILLNALARNGDIPKMMTVVERMVRRGIAANVITCGTISKAFGKHGHVEQIESMMKFMEASGIEVNGYFYASLICACSKSPRPNFSRIAAALQEMADKGIDPACVHGPLCSAIGRNRASRFLSRVSVDRNSIQSRPQVSDFRSLVDQREHLPSGFHGSNFQATQGNPVCLQHVSGQCLQENTQPFSSTQLHLPDQRVLSAWYFRL